MFGKICFSLQLENNKEMHFSFPRNLMMMLLIVDCWRYEWNIFPNKLLANNLQCFDEQYVLCTFLLGLWSPVIIIHVVFIIVVDVVVVIKVLKYNVLYSIYYRYCVDLYLRETIKKYLCTFLGEKAGLWLLEKDFCRDLPRFSFPLK